MSTLIMLTYAVVFLAIGLFVVEAITLMLKMIVLLKTLQKERVVTNSHGI